MTTIVLAHPWHGSFNKAVCDTLVAAAKERGEQVQVIDLNKDDFNPVLKEEELALFGKGQYNDPLVGQYQQMLLRTSKLAFVFPVWWYHMPAILQGFFDKVMLVNFAYTEGKNGLVGLLRHIKKTIVITSSSVPTEKIMGSGGNPFKATFINQVLADIGINDAKWINCPHMREQEGPERKSFLQQVAASLADAN